MKTKLLLITSLLALAIMMVPACRKETPAKQNEDNQGVPYYSTLEEFKQGLIRVANLVASHRIWAYRDTTANGKPDIQGRKEPLIQDVQKILLKLNNEQVEEAVYDVFHFDGKTFSLISYLMKARMVNDISAETLTLILAEIPLPPIPVAGFTPPQIPSVDTVSVDTVATCKCNPKIKIRTTLVYVPDCGNYERKTTGYVVNNKLTGMSSGIYYRFVPEVLGCCHGGTVTYSITAPAGANYAASSSGNPGNGVNFQGLSSGTYSITFTYTCACGASASETITITIK